MFIKIVEKAPHRGSGFLYYFSKLAWPDPTIRALLELLHRVGESDNTEIRTAFGLKHRGHIHKSYLQTALQSGYIEMTIPDKPNNRLERYRLTDAGQRLLESMQE